MAPRTRSAASSPVKKTTAMTDHGSGSEHSIHKVVILPRDISEDARILSLRHPRIGERKRFLFCPQNGLYEFTKTSTPPNDPHSMIFSLAHCVEDGQEMKVDEESRLSDGYISKDAEIFVATKFDVSFILLEMVASKSSTSKKTLFQPLDDILDASETASNSIDYLVRFGRQLLQDGMSSICDTVDAGDEKMYRYSMDKAQNMVFAKAQRAVQSGLPASLEDRFVTRILAPPMLSVKREDTASSFEHINSSALEDADTQVESIDSQSTTTSTAASVVFSELSAMSTTTISTTTTTTSEDIVSKEVTDLQRLRIAQDFIIASYLPTSVAAQFKVSMSSEAMTTTFKPLDDYLQHLATVKAEAVASRSMMDFNRKRGLDEEEAALDRAEKKRKQEEDEKRRKANESRGVRDLKKVNVTGMKKMSEFFMKKPAATKAKS